MLPLASIFKQIKERVMFKRSSFALHLVAILAVVAVLGGKLRSHADNHVASLYFLYW